MFRGGKKGEGRQPTGKKAPKMKGILRGTSLDYCRINANPVFLNRESVSRFGKEETSLNSPCYAEIL